MKYYVTYSLATSIVYSIAALKPTLNPQRLKKWLANPLFIFHSPSLVLATLTCPEIGHPQITWQNCCHQQKNMKLTVA